MKGKSLFGKSIFLLALGLIGIHGEKLNAQTVTFYTPRTVRVEKPQDGQSTRQSLVVIAHPEKVKVKESLPHLYVLIFTLCFIVLNQMMDLKHHVEYLE